MKSTLGLILALFVNFTLFSQAPESFKYQAVVRDVSGNIIASQPVSFRISILQNNTSGTAVYSETHTITTNSYGLANMEIGSGTVESGDFTLIDWSNDLYFIQVGVSQLLSVPYALHAKTAENVFDGDYNSLVNTPTNVSTFTNDAGYITNANDADADPANELQDISLSGSNLSISNGSTIDLSGINTDTQLSEAEVDAYVANNGYLTSETDGSVTNEIQTLNVSGNNLSISSGNSVDFTNVITADSNWAVSGSNISNTNLGNVGVGTAAGAARLTVKTASSANGIEVTNGTGSSIFMNANVGSPGNPYMYFTDGTNSTWISHTSRRTAAASHLLLRSVQTEPGSICAH